MKKQAPITPEMNGIDILATVSEGNPGALTVLAEIVKAKTAAGERWLMTVLDADDMNLRGSLLWVAYKDVCDFDVAQLIARINARDEGLVTAVNAQCPPEFYPQAVTHGASFTRGGGGL